MIAKKQRLQLLKQAVIHMKNQLTETSTYHNPLPKGSGDTSHPLKPSQSFRAALNMPNTDRVSKSPKKQITKLSFQSPLRSKYSPQRILLGHESKDSLTRGSKLNILRQTLDNQFYERKSSSRTKAPHMQSLITLSSMTDRKYYQSAHQQLCNKQNEQVQKQANALDKNALLLQQRHRIKIFSLPFRDPILFPEQKEPLGKKVVKKVEKSPSKFLIQHPNCNSNLKFYGNVGIVSQNKGKMSPDRNRSLIFESGVQISGGRSCSKRHFGRYFEQQFSSGI